VTFDRARALTAYPGLALILVGHALAVAEIPGGEAVRAVGAALVTCAAIILALAGLNRLRLVAVAGRAGGSAPRSPADAAFARLVRTGFVRDVMAVVVSDDGRDTLRHGGAQLDETAVFEIGSVTKTFTGILLADLAQEGVVSLDDSIARFIPGEPLRAVNVLDLATHTAGLPRLPRALLVKALVGDPDPYAGYGSDRLERAALSARGTQTPGERWRYSNFGFALLGLALARAAGEPYERLVARRILEPLGMQATGFDRQPTVTGHDRFGAPVPAWDLAAVAPAGGLRSTLADMEIYLEAQLHPDRTPLAAAILAAHEPRRPIRGGPRRLRGARIGLAWITSDHDGARVTWHNGGTGGFGTFLGFAPETGRGVVALTSSAHTRRLDRACFDVLAARGGAIAEPAHAV
jgi:D-alanyl-D-alanine-carboxypeptidase/D-alanyl-D-alanine-endopeptidase